MANGPEHPHPLAPVHVEHADMSSVADHHVLVTGDLFRLVRGSADDWTWHQETNVFWLEQILTGALGSHPAIQVGILDHVAIGLSRANFGPPPGILAESWWIDQITAELDPSLEVAIRTAVAGKIVVAFEIPENMRRAIEASALALLEIEIAPIRFMNDLLLSAYSENPGISSAIDRSRVTDREVYWYAGVLRAEMGMLAAESATRLGRATLLVAQTPSDRSLVSLNKALDLSDFVSEIKELSKENDIILLSPHPHAGGVIIGIENLLGTPGLRISSANSYRILAAGIVDKLVSISSSLLLEAPYFGVTAQRLGPAPSREFAMIRAQSVGGSIAEEIASIFCLKLAGMGDHALPPEPVVQRTLGFNWAYSGRRDPRPVLPALSLPALPCKLVASQAEFVTGLGYGWHGLEEWGVWSGPLSVLNVEWPQGREERLVCILEVRSEAIGLPIQTVAIWQDERNLAHCAVPTGDNVTVAFEIHRPVRPGPVQLWILCTNAFRPSDWRPNDPDKHLLDNRLLGVGLRSLEFR